ncbi:hypothetical protein LTR56_005800 [Elasticomyces elasticus]|nr:hypothetical protein LTR22_019442 [Elasticomyces elasticus]KAK3651343.1 hypothetical protein LTR56_005800 [Elasticomyces elasticus]KAK4925731.1 hypothetical protein LTR49_007341 [Elasticomyces elasticus]KAK5765063.1 hypothetical protein LTS12_004841 [Elasticomyces elasticus]
MSQEEIVGQFAQAKPVHEDITAVRICATCEGTYSSERAYKRHFGTNAHRLATGRSLALTVSCGMCDKHFTRPSDLKRHQTQGRCPSRLADPNPPSTVLGKRAFDEMTQPLEEQRVIRRLSAACASRPTDGVECRQSFGELVAAAEEPWRVDTVREDNFERALKIALTGVTYGTREHTQSALATTSSLCLDSDHRGVMLDTLLDAAESRKPLEPWVHVGTENLSPPSVVIDYEWVDDLTGFYDFMDLDVLQQGPGEGAADEHELGHSASQPATIIESPTTQAECEVITRPISVGIDDTVLQQSLGSGLKLQHLSEDPVVLPARVIRGRQPLRLREQKCSLCKKPYENNNMALRRHLDSHMAELGSEKGMHFCEVCQVGFVHRQDFRHHIGIANSGSCCGSAPNHTGPCKGYLCGFNFKHTAACNGHHPPTDNHAAWSDHDRFKFGLLNWEIAQLQVVAAEGSKVQRLREVAECISTLSISECGSGKQQSEFSHATSVVSWRSEPFRMKTEAGVLQIQKRKIRMKAEAKDLQLQCVDLNGDRHPSRPQQIMSSLPLGRSSKEEEHLLYAAATGDDDTIISCARQSARLDGALAVAAGQGQVEVVKTLLAFGAPLEIEILYETIAAGKTEVFAVLLSSAKRLTLSQGHTMLHLAVHLGLSAIISMLIEQGVDPNVLLTSTEEHCLMKMSGVIVDRGPPLYVAASKGQTRAVTALLAGKADVDTFGEKGSVLGAALATKDLRCIRAVLSGDKHVAYDSCWVDGNTERDAMTAMYHATGVDMAKELLSHCARFPELRCHHACDALMIAIRRRDRKMVRYCLDLGFSCVHYDPHCALHAACDSWPKPEADDARFILEELVSRRFSLTTVDENGHTPLSRAVWCGNVDAVKILSAAGARESCDKLPAVFWEELNLLQEDDGEAELDFKPDFVMMEQRLAHGHMLSELRGLPWDESRKVDAQPF